MTSNENRAEKNLCSVFVYDIFHMLLNRIDAEFSAKTGHFGQKSLGILSIEM
jgi:hypothetical protein